MSDLANLATEARRNPPRPFIHSGRCDGCGRLGHVFTTSYAVSGGRSVLRTFCTNWARCGTNGGSLEPRA